MHAAAALRAEPPKRSAFSTATDGSNLSCDDYLPDSVTKKQKTDHAGDVSMIGVAMVVKGEPGADPFVKVEPGAYPVVKVEPGAYPDVKVEVGADPVVKVEPGDSRQKISRFRTYKLAQDVEKFG